MSRHSIARRRWTVVAVLVPLAATLAYVVSRSGPLAPVEVTVATVEADVIAPARFGIGTVEARRTYSVGPTAAGRVLRVAVDVGDRVSAGQVVAEVDPVGFDALVDAQRAAVERAAANRTAAAARLRDTEAGLLYARARERRGEALAAEGVVSRDDLEARQRDLAAAETSREAATADLEAAERQVAQVQRELRALREQRGRLRLVSPVDGLVTSRDAEPGTTVVAGQAVVRIIDPESLWVAVRFEQLQAAGLRSGQPATIRLRSLGTTPIAGTVSRVEPLADAVTEETLVKVVFDRRPEPAPPIGELAEVTVRLAATPAAPVVANAALHSVDGGLGVWRLAEGDVHFAPVVAGESDLDGRVQIVDGVEPGDRVVVHSRRELRASSRVRVVERLTEASR